jgi:hypothetical protein
VTDVETCSRGVREHVEHITLGTAGVNLDLVGLLVSPTLLPSLLNGLEVVFHNYIKILIFNKQSLTRPSRLQTLSVPLLRGKISYHKRASVEIGPPPKQGDGGGHLHLARKYNHFIDTMAL